MTRYHSVVQFEAVRSLAIPPPPDTAWWGGRGSPRKFCRPHFPFHATVNIVATALRRARFQALQIEIFARQKVAQAFEPQQASGKGVPASKCNAMDASG